MSILILFTSVLLSVAMLSSAHYQYKDNKLIAANFHMVLGVLCVVSGACTIWQSTLLAIS